MKFTLIPGLLLAASLTGCYLDKGDEATFPEYRKTGVISDSPISGMPYSLGDERVYRTNFRGEFSYEEGQLIRFHIAGYRFPAIQAQPLVTPMTLAGTDDLSDRRVTNIAYLLQALDTDQQPDNGIQFLEELYDDDFDFYFDQDPADFIASFAFDDLVWGYLDGVVPDYDAALDHLYRQHGLRGSWIYSDNDAVHFLRDGIFIYESAEGFEFGSYSTDYTEGQVTVSISDDMNGSQGFGPQQSVEFDIQDTNTLTFIDGPANASYQRTAFSELALTDTWYVLVQETDEPAESTEPEGAEPESTEPDQHYLLSLLENGHYTLIRVSAAGGGAIDRGTYTRVSGGIRLTSTEQQNADLGVFSFDTAERQYNTLISENTLQLISTSVNITMNRQ